MKLDISKREMLHVPYYGPTLIVIHLLLPFALSPHRFNPVHHHCQLLHVTHTCHHLFRPSAVHLCPKCHHLHLHRVQHSRRLSHQLPILLPRLLQRLYQQVLRHPNQIIVMCSKVTFTLSTKNLPISQKRLLTFQGLANARVCLH